MMLLQGAALWLLVMLALGLLRIWLGPSPADRMLAAQLFGTTGTALLLILAQLQQEAALTLGVGLFAAAPFSPLSWAQLIAARMYLP